MFAPFFLYLVQYSTLNVGLSSGRLCRRSYSRVVAMFACPNHSCTLAMSALCARALVAAHARRSLVIFVDSIRHQAYHAPAHVGSSKLRRTTTHTPSLPQNMRSLRDKFGPVKLD